MSDYKLSDCTPGPWRIYGKAKNHHVAIIDSIPDVDGKVVANCICHVALTNPDWEANANLIAEAGTVAHETGLTPRELMEQRDKLLAACEAYVDCDNQCGFNLAYVMSKDAIAKCKKGGE